MRFKIFDIDIDDVISVSIKHVGVSKFKNVCQNVSNHTGLLSIRTIAFYICLVGLNHTNKNLGLNCSSVDPVDFINNCTFELLPQDNAEYIYFIQDEANKYIKIGYSKNPVSRKILLQGGNPNELNILAVIPGDRQDEAEIHEIYKDLRVRGEWFSPDKRLLDFICSIENKAIQTCPDCGKTHNIFLQEVWKTCCLLNFDFPFPVKINED